MGKEGEKKMREPFDRAKFVASYVKHNGELEPVMAEIGLSRSTFYTAKRECLNEIRKAYGLPEEKPEAKEAEEPKPLPLDHAMVMNGAAQAAKEMVMAEAEKMIKEKVKEIGDNIKNSMGPLVTKAARDAADAAVERQYPYKGVELRLENRPEVKVEGFMPEWFQDALSLVSHDIPTILVGPAGCGKTHVAGKIAEAMNLRFGFLSLSSGVSESALLGWLVPGDGGKFEYLASQYVDFYENGGVFLLDEVDAADANVLMVMNASLSNGHLAIPQRAKAPVAKRHKDFRIIAAANTYGQGANRTYMGRNALDGAFLDRFEIVDADYDKKVERGVVAHPEILAWAKIMRSNIEKFALRRNLSTRKLIRYAHLRQNGWEMDKIMDAWTKGWDGEEVKKVKNGYAGSKA